MHKDAMRRLRNAFGLAWNSRHRLGGVECFSHVGPVRSVDVALIEGAVAVGHQLDSIFAGRKPVTRSSAMSEGVKGQNLGS